MLVGRPPKMCPRLGLEDRPRLFMGFISIVHIGANSCAFVQLDAIMFAHGL